MEGRQVCLEQAEQYIEILVPLQRFAPSRRQFRRPASFEKPGVLAVNYGSWFARIQLYGRSHLC